MSLVRFELHTALQAPKPDAVFPLRPELQS